MAITVGVALFLFIWAVFKTILAYTIAEKYTRLAGQLEDSKELRQNRSEWSLRKGYPLASEFNDLLVEVPRIGADVLVLGNRKSGNILVQVKTTTAKKLDSEKAVRALEGARPFFENALGEKFPHRCLHTNAKNFSRRIRDASKLYRTDSLGLRSH